MTTVRCEIIEGQPEVLQSITGAENLQRKDWSLVEEGEYYHNVHGVNSISYREMSKSFGIPISRISYAINAFTKLSPDELEKCEVVIESGKQVFIEVGNALREIRDRKGYRHKYGTFEEYCKQRWGFSVSGAYKQIKASEAAQLIQQNVDTCPQIDYGKARTVATLTPPQQVAFAETHDISEMTSREVEKAVKGRLRFQPTLFFHRRCQS